MITIFIERNFFQLNLSYLKDLNSKHFKWMTTILSFSQKKIK